MPVSLVRDSESLTHKFHIGQPLKGDTTIGSLICILMVIFVLLYTWWCTFEIQKRYWICLWAVWWLASQEWNCCVELGCGVVIHIHTFIRICTHTHTHTLENFEMHMYMVLYPSLRISVTLCPLLFCHLTKMWCHLYASLTFRRRNFLLNFSTPCL
jgi:hypothetical protein